MVLRMVFIFRTVFWFCIVLAFWPNNEENQKKTIEIILNSTPDLSESITSQTQKLAALTLSYNAFPGSDYFTLRPSIAPDLSGSALPSIPVQSAPSPHPGVQ